MELGHKTKNRKKMNEYTRKLILNIIAMPCFGLILYKFITSCMDHSPRAGIAWVISFIIAIVIYVNVYDALDL